MPKKRIPTATITSQTENEPEHEPVPTPFTAADLQELAAQMQTVAEGLAVTQSMLAETKSETKAIKRKLDVEAASSSSSSSDWKNKGHKEQYDVQVRTLNTLTQAATALKNEEYQSAKAFITSGIKIVSARIKDVKMADNSPAGWGLVNEYRRNNVAADEEDANKIRRCETAALAKQQNHKKESSERGCGGNRGNRRG
jgi:hypothetical protein